MNKLKLWQKRYILSVKILLSVVFAGTVGFIFYHVPYDSLFLYPLYVLVALGLLYLYAIQDAKWDMHKEWQEWVDRKLQTQEYVDAILFLQQRQMDASSLDPILPYYKDFKVSSELNYNAFLAEKFKDQPLIQEMYR